MNGLNIRSTNRYFAEDLADDLARDTWKILERSGSVEAMLMGSFLTVRVALNRYVRGAIKQIAALDDGTYVFAIKVGRFEPDTFGMEATAAVATAQEGLFSRLANITRVTRRITEAAEAALTPYRRMSAQASMARVMVRTEARVRNTLTREPAFAESSAT